MTDRVIFVSHGAPTLATSDCPANGFMRELGPRLGTPEAIVVVSPHWAQGAFRVKSPPRFRTWHDFRGFPPELYQLRYEPPGSAAVAESVRERLREAGLDGGLETDDDRLDHGAWVPLMLMFPAANIPVVQVSLGPGGPTAHRALGEALAPLAQRNILILGTGSITHNLGEIDPESAPPRAWAQAFDGWLAERVAVGDAQALLDYRREAPNAVRAHPEEDHLLPFFTALGAGGGSGRRLHDSYTYGTLSMAAYAFDPC